MSVRLIKFHCILTKHNSTAELKEGEFTFGLNCNAIVRIKVKDSAQRSKHYTIGVNKDSFFALINNLKRRPVKFKGKPLIKETMLSKGDQFSILIKKL